MSLALLFGASLLMTPPATPISEQTTARTAQGLLVGRTDEGVESFKGIRFAQAPVGPLRWRPPVAPSPWEGPREAGEAGAMGDVVSVTNPQSKRVLQGTVSGPGRISVQASSAGRVAAAQ